MFLFFYKVDNDREFTRDFFDGMQPEKAAEILTDLNDEEGGVVFYDLDNSHPNGRFRNMQDFVEDYNDEELDGGYWSLLLDISYEKMREIVYGKEWWTTSGVYPNETIPTQS